MANKLAGIKFRMKTPFDDAVANGQAVPTVDQFQHIGGFQSNTFETNVTVIDTTNKDSENSQILDERGIVSRASSGEGLVENSEIFKKLEINAENRKLRWFLFERDDGRTFVAKFKISNLTRTGSYDDAVKFSASFQSSGPISITDEDGASFDTGLNRFVSFSSELANFDLISTFTGNYDGSDRDAFVSSYVQAFNLLSTNAVSQTPSSDITLDGSQTAGEEGFPVFFIKKSDLAGNRYVQVTDTVLNSPVRVISLEDKQDEVPTDWRAFYIPQLRGNGEGLIVNLVVGEV